MPSSAYPTSGGQGSSLQPYTASDVVTVANTTAEASCFSPLFEGIGRTVPAGILMNGSRVSLLGDGLYAIPLLTPGTVTIRSKVNGSTVVAVTTSGITSLLGGAVNLGIEVRHGFVVRKRGAGWRLVPFGGVNFQTPTGTRATVDMLNGGTEVAFNPLTACTFDFTVQWQIASVTRTITIVRSELQVRL